MDKDMEKMMKNEEQKKETSQGTSFPVLVTLTGRNEDENGMDEDGAIKMMIKGKMTKTSDGWNLDYVETDPESGLSQPIALEMKPGSVSMTRKGPYETCMVFEKGKRFEGRYNTPYGNLNMGIFCTRALWRVEETKGFVALRYQLDLQGAFAASHELKLQFVRMQEKQ